MALNLVFGEKVNGTNNPGLLDMSHSPPRLFCYCSRSNAEIIMNGLNPKPKRKSTVFVIPTIDEIREYCESRKNGIDAEKFWHSYNSKNWIVGRAKMTSWKSAVITWEKNPQYNNEKPQQAVIGRSTLETVAKNTQNWL